MPRQILAAFLILASVFTALPVKAALPTGNFSELKSINSAKVEQVIDPQTIRLDDKRVIRLSGIEYPDLNPYMPGPLSVMAMKILKDLLEGKTVNVYQTQDSGWGRSNRMDQQLAHLELQKGSAWAQGTVLALGLARVMTDERTPEMASQMYQLEDIARQSKNGLWALDKYKIIKPEEAKDHTGSVAIVEGRVRGTGMNQNRIYLNFGDDWKSDFTVSVRPENRQLFFDRNIDPLKWNGRLVRVRGWIGDYNGPFIEIDHPEALELIEEKDTQKDAAAFPLKTAPQGPMLRSTSNN